MPFISFPGAFDRDELEQAGKEFIVDTVSKVVPTPPVPLVTLVAEGDPAASLIKASEDADLLVLGNPRPVALGRAPARLGQPAPCGGCGLPRRADQAPRREGLGRRSGLGEPRRPPGTACSAPPARLAVPLRHGLQCPSGTARGAGVPRAHQCWTREYRCWTRE